MKRWKRVTLVTVGIVLLLAGFIAFMLPGIAKNQTVKRVEAATGRRLAIGEVSINPFTWTVEVQNLRLSERTGTNTFAAFSSARIALSPSSIFRGAPIISEARLASPYLRIIRTGANSYNFSDLLEGKKQKKEEKQGLPRFSLNNVAMTNGAIDFIDRGLPVEKRHELRKIQIAVPFVTTIPYLAEQYITPRFSAVVNGSPLHAEGKLRPFPKAVEASVTIDLKALSLPFYLAYFPGQLPVRVESGRMSAKVAISYRAAQKENPELALSGSVSLADTRVSDRTGAPLLAVTRLDAEITGARLLAREFALSSVSAESLEIFLSRDKKGIWSHTRLAGRASPATPGSGKILVNVAETRLRNGRIHFSDNLPAGRFSTDLQEIELDMQGYSTAPEKKAGYSLSFTTSRGEKGRLKGMLSPVPFEASSSVELTGVVVEAYYPYLATLVGAPVKGKLKIAGEMRLGGAAGMQLDKVALQARQISAPFPEDEGLTLASLSLSGGRFNYKENLLEVADIKLRNGDLRFSRDPGGTFSALTFFSGQPGEGGGEEKKRTKPVFRYRIGRVSGSGITATFMDRQLEEQPKFILRKLDFSLEKLTGPAFGPLPFKVTAAYGRDGSLNASGSFTPSPMELKGDLAVQRIPLPDFADYFPKGLNLTLAEGRIDARVALSLSKTGNNLTGTFDGEGGVRSLYCLDAKGEDLLKWESLQLDDVKGSLAPFSLNIRDVALTRFYSRIVIEPGGILNLQQLYTPKAGTERPTLPSRNVAAASEKGSVRIDGITMQEGTLAFTDRNLPQEFSTVLHNLGGRISGLSSEESSLADVDLRGNLENQSPLGITGRINPLRDDLFADIKVSFTEIELSPMTPYSGTYLGYVVDKGKLSLDLRYRIENRKLESNNKVFIDQFNFGRRVESDKATSLPVRLAVALLKNRKGEIHLDLPVTGQTDDPQFSVGRVVLRMLKNLLVKAATSPFALLQSMMGGEEDFSSVAFIIGSAELSGSEREKILKLARVLGDRPELKIEVTGFVDKGRDAEGYRNELLQKKIRTEKFLDLVKEKKNQPGDAPETVRISPEENEKYLKAVYAKEKFPKPRNIFGLVKNLPGVEMRKLILANTVVGEPQLRALAEARAAGVRAFLVDEGKIDSSRVYQKSGDIYKPPAKEGEPGSRVEFGVAAN